MCTSLRSQDGTRSLEISGPAMTGVSVMLGAIALDPLVVRRASMHLHVLARPTPCRKLGSPRKSACDLIHALKGVEPFFPVATSYPPPVYRSPSGHLYFSFTRFQGAPSSHRLDGVLSEDRSLGLFHAETHIPAEPPPPLEGARLSHTYE